MLPSASHFWVGAAGKECSPTASSPPATSVIHQRKAGGSREVSSVGLGVVGQMRQGAAACKKIPLLFQAVILAHPHGPQELGDRALVLGTLETAHLSLDFTAALGRCSRWVCL